ncbi:hypothetical protein KY290_028000 [Solanum tuberosum]|uniref:ABC-2 type transporter transmembrane domain-containing protein n=1 Tax=Solanum tuberosum TaxID=4113 RepID=A0ABQ7UHV3_SOLTU|nr:hypothetical protein KY290_028000 [Solanum tuberosum]
MNVGDHYCSTRRALLGIDSAELYKNSRVVGRQQDLFNAIGSMYAVVMLLNVQNSSAVQPIISIERTVFYRKIAAGMYSTLPYAFGKVQIHIPRWIGTDSFKILATF